MSDIRDDVERRKIPWIRMERPNGGSRRWLRGLLVGLLAGFLVGVLLTVASRWGGHDIEFASGGWLPYVWICALSGAVAGAVLGTCYQKAASPTIALREIELKRFRLRRPRRPGLVRSSQAD